MACLRVDLACRCLQHCPAAAPPRLSLPGSHCSPVATVLQAPPAAMTWHGLRTSLPASCPPTAPLTTFLAKPSLPASSASQRSTNSHMAPATARDT